VGVSATSGPPLSPEQAEVWILKRPGFLRFAPSEQIMLSGAYRSLV
jgi:hypothetical protein